MLELDILGMGELSERAVGKAVGALIEHEDAQAHEVIAADDEIDEKYMSIENRVLQVMALQTPVAGDLRLISVILHSNLHLERIGDMAVNIAKIYLSVSHLPTSQSIQAQIREMDDPVDRLNLGMYKEVAALAGDPELLNWGLRMILVARQLERVGDHSVDIGEQVGFLLTGEFREFTDASHPVDITPDAG